MGCPADDGDVVGDQVAEHQLPPRRHEEGAAGAGPPRHTREVPRGQGADQVRQRYIHRPLPAR